MSRLGLDRMTEVEARQALATCCDAERWVEAVLAGRPYATADAARTAARTAWRALGPDDWRAAIGHHPRLGSADLERARFASTRELSRGEQAGLASSPADARADLARAQAAYEERFGFVFLVHAKGKSAAEILATVERRMDHAPDAELAIAARELEAITLCRLEPLLATDEGAA